MVEKSGCHLHRAMEAHFILHYPNPNENKMKDAHILLVEDNEGDIVLTQEALADAKIKNKVTVSRDGEEAINYLTNATKNPEELFPDLILLDINLPKVDGKEVLHYIKTTPALKKIPVVMLSPSSSEVNIADSLTIMQIVLFRSLLILIDFLMSSE